MSAHRCQLLIGAANGVTEDPPERRRWHDAQPDLRRNHDQLPATRPLCLNQRIDLGHQRRIELARCLAGWVTVASECQQVIR